MTEELKSIEDVFVKLHTHLQNTMCNQRPDSSSVALALQCLNKVHKKKTTDGTLSGKTKTLTHILRLAKENNWRALQDSYDYDIFTDASKEMMVLKEIFGHIRDSKVGMEAIRQQVTMQDRQDGSTRGLRAEDLIDKISVFLNKCLTMSDTLEESDVPIIRQYINKLLDFVSKEQISAPSTVALDRVLRYIGQERYSWNGLKQTKKDTTITNAFHELKEIQSVIGRIERRAETSSEDRRQGDQVVTSLHHDTADQDQTDSLSSHSSDCTTGQNTQSAKQNVLSQSPNHSEDFQSYNKENGSQQANLAKKVRCITAGNQGNRNRNSNTKEQEPDEMYLKDREISSLKKRVSRMAGDMLTERNPNIADLSDVHRPTKLAEAFSELYDNEWSDAYEELMQMSQKRDELVVIEKLLTVIRESQRFCAETISSQRNKLLQTLTQQMVDQDADLDNIEQPGMPLQEGEKKILEAAEPHLKRAQRITASLSIPVLKLRFRKKMEAEFTKTTLSELKDFWRYIEHSVEVIWYMSMLDPPMFVEECKAGDRSPPNFKEYTKRGQTVKALVWPALRLYEKGPVLKKGVAMME